MGYVEMKMNKIKRSAVCIAVILGMSSGIGLPQAYADASESYVAGNLQEYKDSMTKALMNRTAKFSIDYTGPTSDITSNFKSLVSQHDNPDDYLRWCISSYNAVLKGTTQKSTTTLEYTYVATLEEERRVDARIDELLPNIVLPGMSQADAVYAVHKYIIDNVSYDKSLANHSSYDALIERSAVCQGYALLLDKMLEKCGIESRIVDGDIPRDRHAWNKVKIDGKWYNVDATNDDTSNNKFYCVSDSVLSASGFKWDASRFPQSPDTLEYVPGTGEAAPVSAVAAYELKPYDDSLRDIALSSISKMSDSTLAENFAARVEAAYRQAHPIPKDTLDMMVKSIQALSTAGFDSDYDKLKLKISALPQCNDKQKLISELEGRKKAVNLRSMSKFMSNIKAYMKNPTKSSVISASIEYGRLHSGTDKISKALPALRSLEAKYASKFKAARK